MYGCRRLEGHCHFPRRACPRTSEDCGPRDLRPYVKRREPSLEERNSALGHFGSHLQGFQVCRSPKISHYGLFVRCTPRYNGNWRNKTHAKYLQVFGNDNPYRSPEEEPLLSDWRKLAASPKHKKPKPLTEGLKRQKAKWLLDSVKDIGRAFRIGAPIVGPSDEVLLRFDFSSPHRERNFLDHKSARKISNHWLHVRCGWLRYFGKFPRNPAYKPPAYPRNSPLCMTPHPLKTMVSHTNVGAHAAHFLPFACRQTPNQTLAPKKGTLCLSLYGQHLKTIQKTTAPFPQPYKA